jgi:hypothetical protein
MRHIATVRVSRLQYVPTVNVGLNSGIPRIATVNVILNCSTIIHLLDIFVCSINTVKKLQLCKKRTVSKKPRWAWCWYWWGKDLVWIRCDHRTIFLSNLIGSWLVNAYLCCVNFISRSSVKKGTGTDFLTIRRSQFFGYRISYAGRGLMDMSGVVWASL